MTDVFSRRKRSEIMSSVRSKDTGPEKTVAGLVRSLGHRPSLNVKKLPGTPDVVLPTIRKIIFVHSCFFHQHDGCRARQRPKTHKRFWNDKLDRNVKRDARVRRQLNRLGWSVAVVWECQLKDIERLRRRLEKFLNNKR